MAQWALPVMGTLHREDCSRVGGRLVRDLNRLGRDLSRTVMVSADAQGDMVSAIRISMTVCVRVSERAREVGGNSYLLPSE